MECVLLPTHGVTGWVSFPLPASPVSLTGGHGCRLTSLTQSTGTSGTTGRQRPLHKRY